MISLCREEDPGAGSRLDTFVGFRPRLCLLLASEVVVVVVVFVAGLVFLSMAVPISLVLGRCIVLLLKVEIGRVGIADFSSCMISDSSFSFSFSRFVSSPSSKFPSYVLVGRW